MTETRSGLQEYVETYLRTRENTQVSKYSINILEQLIRILADVRA